ncbi:MAG: hypothetical protein IKL53_02000, partial [Lachnospiraceae bacterium]|nr:hypothetical protein [Lachnospiraceae bacterium]
NIGLGLTMEDEDLVANQLSVKLLDALNIDGSYAYKAHKYYSGQEREDKLRLIAYDMLFGEKYMYDDGIVVPETGMKMGVDVISITSGENETNHIVIRGENFTEYSVVYVDDEDLETIYVDRQTLMVEDEQLEPGDEITVRQVDKSHHVLSSTEIYLFQ